MGNIFESKEYKYSRKAYTCQAALEYFASILVADAFLAKLLTEIGISDSLTGIISSLISFTFLFQLFSILLVEKMTNTKKTVIIFDTLSQLFFISIYFIPFIPISHTAKTVCVITGLLIAYFSKYLIMSIYYKWANSFVEPAHRGDFSAVKEMVSLVGGIVFTLIMGYIIDAFESIGNINGGFLFIAATLFVLNVCNFISLLLIKENDGGEHEFVHKSVTDLLKNTFGNKGFVNVLIMTSLWEIARYMTIGFMGTFKLKELLISVGGVQVINMLANLTRLFLTRPFGKYSDRTSYARGFNLALIIAAVGFLFNMFSTRNTWWCVVVFTILYSVSLAGTNQNGFNILYNYVRADYMVQAMAITKSIGGILGFCASILGSRIIAAAQQNGNMILGIHAYGQQILSAISLIIIAATILFNNKVVFKQKIMRQ